MLLIIKMTKEFVCPIDKPIQQMGIKTKLDKLYYKKTKETLTKLETDIKTDTGLFNIYARIKDYKKIGPGTDGIIRLDSNIEKEIRRKLKAEKIKGKKISTVQINRIIKFIKLEREYNVKMDNLNSSKVLQNIINYDYMSKIPPPTVPCEYSKQNCMSYNNGQGAQDVTCCDKGELKILRCGIKLSECSNKAKIKSTKKTYRTAVKGTTKENYFKKFTNSTGSLKDSKYKEFAYCPSLVNDKKQYCNNIYDFSYKKQSDKKDTGITIEGSSTKKITGNKLSESVYDNIKGLGMYGKILTDPNIGVGSDYLISTHKCIDNEGKEQYVQTPIRNSGERVGKYKKIADAINKLLVESKIVLTDKNTIIYSDVQSAKFINDMKKLKVGDTYKLKGHSFTINDEVFYLSNMDDSSGLVYTLIDDIKETNPVSLLTRFIAQSENASMKCKDIAEYKSRYPFSQYVVESDGYDFNDNVELTTKREYPVDMRGCYVLEEGFSKTNYYLEIVILLFIFVIVINYF